MTGRLRVVLAAGAALLAAAPARAATLTVMITGLADTGYELNVAGIVKNGRLGPAPGPATVRDLVEVGARASVKAVVTFTGPAGVIASCEPVEVKLSRAQAECEPAFVLTGTQTGTETFACKTTCVARKKTEKSDDDDDDDDWVYAMASPLPAPRLDGWALMSPGQGSSQSFYTRAMSSASGPALYSPAERQTR